MAKLTVSAAPHIHSGASTNRIMLDVVLSLLPAAAAAVVIFGTKSLVVILACVLTAVVSEFLFNLACGKKQTVGDFSAVVTGLLLALNLSTNVPAWQCVVGTAFAVICVKCIFGGLGHNFANPAITGRVFMLVAFSAVAGGANPTVVELTTSATPLEQLAKGDAAVTTVDLFLGLHGGAIGETCILALVIGGIYLLVRKVIRWHIPVVFIATVFVLYLIFTGDVTMAVNQIFTTTASFGSAETSADSSCPIGTRGHDSSDSVIICTPLIISLFSVISLNRGLFSSSL